MDRRRIGNKSHHVPVIIIYTFFKFQVFYLIRSAFQKRFSAALSYLQKYSGTVTAGTLSAFSKSVLMVARALFLSSSFSIGSTAQQGRAVRLYSNLAYLTQTPRRGYKTQYTRSFHLRSDFFVGIGILSVTLKTPKLKCLCLVFLRYSEVRFKKKVTSGCRAQYLKKGEFIFDSEHKAQNSYLQNPQLLQRKGSFSSQLMVRHLWHWNTFSPQLLHTPGLAGTVAEHRGHCSDSPTA